MEYILLEWFHDFQEYPCLIYSEVDADRYEVRKIEVYKSGTCLRYGGEISGGLMELGDVPFPEDLDEINRYKQFSAKNITKEEFEIIWRTHS